MRRYRVTLSKIALLSHCQAWARLDAEWSTEPASTYAVFGSGCHGHLAAHVDPSQPCDVPMDERMAAVVAQGKAWCDAHLPKRSLSLFAEQAFAWNPETDTARAIEGKGRDYSAASDDEMTGTLDLVWMTEPGVANIVDHKTGDGTGAEAQLAGQALFVSRAWNVDTVHVKALELTETDTREVCKATYDSFALAAIAGDLAEDLAAIPTAEPQPGPHCRELYCPHRVACPAQNAAAEALVPIEALTEHRMGLEIRSPEHAAWMLARVELILAAAESVKDVLKGYSREHGGITLGDKTWREVPSVRQSIDGKAALALAERSGAAPGDLADCMRSATIMSTRWVNAEGKAKMPRARKAKVAP